MGATHLLKEGSKPIWEPITLGAWCFVATIPVGMMLTSSASWSSLIFRVAFAAAFMVVFSTFGYFLCESSYAWTDHGRRPWRRLLTHWPCNITAACSQAVGAWVGALLAGIAVMDKQHPGSPTSLLFSLAVHALRPWIIATLVMSFELFLRRVLLVSETPDNHHCQRPQAASS